MYDVFECWTRKISIENNVGISIFGIDIINHIFPSEYQANYKLYSITKAEAMNRHQGQMSSHDSHQVIGWIEMVHRPNFFSSHFKIC